MAPKRAHSKSQSISSNPDVNGLLTPTTPASKALAPVQKRRSRSTTSPPGSPAVTVLQRKDSTSGLSPAVKFVLAIILSTALEALLQTLASNFGTGELAAVSKQSDSWFDAVGLLAWKVIQLTVAWFSGFDAYDIASLTLLLSTPSSILLGLFYDIRPTTLVVTTAVSMISSTIPWLMLRPIAPAHNPSGAPKTAIRNRPILTDPYTTIATSLLATAIFAVLLEVSFATFLPTWLITNFAGLRSLEAAHLGASGLPTLLLALIPAGVACMEFLFAPSTAAASTKVIKFDTRTASLGAHIYHNAWGWYSARQKELISRTTTLAALMMVECVLHVWGTIKGAELIGAVGYAGIWAFGVAMVGAVLDWVGGPSD